MVEVIVTMVIAIIIISVSSSFIITGTNIFSRSVRNDTQLRMTESVLDFVSGQLLFASAISEEEALDTDGAAIRFTDPAGLSGDPGKGQLFFRRSGDDGEMVNIFGAGFYNDYSVSMECEITEASEDERAFFELKVSLYDNKNPEKELLTRTATKTLLNYRGDSKTLGGSDDYILIGYPSSLQGSGVAREDAYRVAMSVITVLDEYGKSMNEASMGSFYNNGNGATGVLDTVMFNKIAEKAGLAPGSVGFAETAGNWYINVRSYDVIIHFTNAVDPGPGMPGEQKLWATTTAGSSSVIWLCVLVGDNDYYRIKLKG